MTMRDAGITVRDAGMTVRDAGMTVWWDCLVFILTFDSSPVKGEGYW